MAQACNPSYAGGWDQEGHKFKSSLMGNEFKITWANKQGSALKLKEKKVRAYSSFA